MTVTSAYKMYLNVFLSLNFLKIARTEPHKNRAYDVLSTELVFSINLPAFAYRQILRTVLRKNITNDLTQ